MSRSTRAVRRAAACTAAVLSLAAGLADLALRQPPRDPAWSARLAPLADAPLVAGEAVALALPAGLPAGDAERVLFEAAWLRPDVRWGLRDAWTGVRPPQALVLPWSDDPAPIAGWRPAWRGGSLRLLRPGGA